MYKTEERKNRVNPRIYPVDIFGYMTMLRIFSLKK